MPLSYVDVLIFGAGITTALALAAIAYGVRVLADLSRRVAKLEKRANPASKHDLRYLERQDIGEATLFDLAHLDEQLEMSRKWLELARRRALHVAGGGAPDDNPTKWAKDKPQ